MKLKHKILLPILAVLLILSGVTLAVFASDPEATTATSGSLDVYKCNLSFRSNVCIKYAIATEDASVKMLIWRAPQTEYTYGSQAAILNPVGTDTIDEKNCLIFDYTELAAADMTEVVYARAYKDNGDGTYTYGAVKKYSILQYAYNKLGYTATASTDENLKQMLRDMLVYGASAQKYLDRNTDRLATADFYQVVVEGGLLADGCTEGLYLPGESVTLIAPETNAEGQAFSGWTNAAGERTGSTATYALTVPTKHDTYTAVYETVQYSQGLAFFSYGDGTCYVSGVGTCTDLDIIIPPVSPKGDRVTSIGYGAFQYHSNLTSITIPEGVTSIDDYAFSWCSSLTSVTFAEGSQLTSIGDYAFSHCSSLTSITIPASVTRIGDYAFSWRSSLTSVTFAEGSQLTSIGNSAFYDCSSLTSITIPASVTSIGDDAFRACSSLTSITIPASVTSIGAYAFYGCSSLTSITIPASVTSIGASAFSGCTKLIQTENGVSYVDKWVIDCGTSVTNVVLRDGTVGIGNSAFYNCSSLTSITIPESVTSIGDEAFRSCSGLTSITVDAGNTVYHSAGNCLIETASKTLIAGCKTSVIPADGSVTSIGNGAFSGCSSLASITIPASVTSIGEWAFYGCSGLTSITIPAGVTSIGRSAFAACSSLTGITVDVGNTVYHSAGNCLIETASKTLIAGCKTSVIPADGSVTSIGDYAFSWCSSLTSITIPASVTSIGSYAFSYCSGLTSITIPASVTSIGDNAFYWCSGLTSITIPASVTSIGSYAFFGCTKLIQTENGVSYVDKWVIDCDTSVTNVVWRDGTVGIGGAAFYGHSGLTSITIPASVTSIGDYAFSWCSSLTSITIPASVTRIGDYAFSRCSSLTSVTFAEGSQLTSIGDYAFEDCSSLTSVTFAEGSQLTSIGDNAFYWCSGLTSITIPASVTRIGDYAFSWCRSLTSVTFAVGSQLTSIGDYAFSWCSSLTSITIPASVTSIGDYAFEDCSSLTSITIPEGVTSIGYSAFSYCSSLTSVTFENTTGWYRTSSSTATSGPEMDVSDPATNATYLRSTYYHYWKRS